MNIKEHIEAEHYPVDHLKRALVPERGGGVATIYATDHSNAFPIAGKDTLGWLRTWDENGSSFESTAFRKADLLPPSPRKVKKALFGLRNAEGDVAFYHYYTRSEAERASRENGSYTHIIELHTEFELP